MCMYIGTAPPALSPLNFIYLLYPYLSLSCLFLFPLLMGGGDCVPFLFWPCFGFLVLVLFVCLGLFGGEGWLGWWNGVGWGGALFVE